jgi:hypothetical protein
MSAKRHPGRGGAAWERARALALANADLCAICGYSIDREAPARSRWSASVDHLVSLKAMRGLDAGEQRQLALDPANLRVVHYGCNARRGSGRRVALGCWKLLAQLLERGGEVLRVGGVLHQPVLQLECGRSCLGCMMLSMIHVERHGLGI